VVALFALALVAIIGLYAALSVPGAWFPAATAKVMSARDLALTRGAGALDRDALVISALDASGLALVTANSDFRSSEFPVVAWTGANFPEGADVRFLWRTDYAPTKLNSAPVAIVAGRLRPVSMATYADWVGRITGVALAVRGPLAAPVRVYGVAMKPGGVAGQLADLRREWFEFEPWSGASINTITGGADVQDLPLPTLVVVAAALAACIWFALAYRRRRTAALPVVLAGLFVVAWLVVDAQWMLNLTRQAEETRTQFGGKDLRERHVAMEDGPLYQFIEKARAKLPAPPVRVFVVADAAYFRGRAAYHLYPHNVLFDPRENSVPPVASLRPGDFVLVYLRRGVQYNAEDRKLRFEGSEPVAAEAVLVEPGAALFRVL
jgi:hypothetical protein